MQESIRHKCRCNFAKNISITIAGAGGTGSAVAASLGRMAKALMSLHPDYDMSLTICDPANVKMANLGRQPYGLHDLGLNKALALANTMTHAFPIRCHGATGKYTSTKCDILIICVDSAKARHEILANILTAPSQNTPNYIIDCGNMKDFGQCVIGLNPNCIEAKEGEVAMPPPWDSFPELYDPSKDNPSEASCSSAEALASQDYNVNHFAAMIASEHIWKLITKGELKTRGAFFNLRTMTCSPLKMDGTYKQLGKALKCRGQSGESYNLSIMETASIKYLKNETIGRHKNSISLHRIVDGLPINPLTMTPFQRENNALWRNIDTLLS